MSQIKIDIGSPDPGLTGRWHELAARAGANVFMHPLALHAAHSAGLAKIHVLHAWRQADGEDRLVGIWALQERRIARYCARSLSAPPHRHAFLSNPVIEPALAEPVVRSFFDAIERHPDLPKVIRLRYLDGAGETVAAIMHALNTRQAKILTLSDRQRAFVSKDGGRKGSGSTRKKLRQYWNRLSALGEARVINDRTPSAVREAFEAYLTLEANSWKGTQQTALLSDNQDAAFARRLVGDLADCNSASVALLCCEGETIAAQVLLYCATTAYTWKTAFDPRYAKYSPGAVLVDRITDELFATGGISGIESCSPEGGFMSQIWEGRRSTVDLLVDLGTKGSLNFMLAEIEGRGYAQLKELRNRIRSVARASSVWRKGMAAPTR